MSDYIRIFNKLAGLQNNIAEYRLYTQRYDPREIDQTIPLNVSKNFMFDDSQSAVVRPGYAEAMSGSWHSLFCDTTDAVGVRGQDLVLVESGRVLTSGIEDRVSYAQVNDEVYYTCGAKQGRIVEGIHLPWLDLATVPYETNRAFVQRVPAKLIAFHLSRIWLANENYVVFSEPLGFSLFDLHQNTLMFDDEVVMIRSVAGGIFISTTKKVYFLPGNEPNNLERKVAAQSPALPWSVCDTLIEGHLLGLNPEIGSVACWVGRDGIYIGSSDGTAKNVTETMIALPDGYGPGTSVPFGEQLFFCMNKS